jgi:hypothetical protein
MRTSLSKVLEVVMLRCTYEDIDFWAVPTKKIWLRKNFVVFGGVFIPHKPLVQESHVLLGDFRRVNALVEIEGNNLIVAPPPPCLWKALPFGLYKIN